MQAHNSITTADNMAGQLFLYLVSSSGTKFMVSHTYIAQTNNDKYKRSFYVLLSILLVLVFMYY